MANRNSTSQSKEFEKKVFYPQKMDETVMLEELKKEAEILERYEASTKNPNKKMKKEAVVTHHNNQPVPPTTLSNPVLKFCREHGHGGHATKDCWTVHPKLRPSKFKKKEGNFKKTSDKGTQAAIQEEFYATLFKNFRKKKQQKNQENKRKRKPYNVGAEGFHAEEVEKAFAEYQDLKDQMESTQDYVAELEKLGMSEDSSMEHEF